MGRHDGCKMRDEERIKRESVKEVVRGRKEGQNGQRMEGGTVIRE